jgi:hypothetical protein
MATPGLIERGREFVFSCHYRPPYFLGSVFGNIHSSFAFELLRFQYAAGRSIGLTWLFSITRPALAGLGATENRRIAV